MRSRRLVALSLAGLIVALSTDAQAYCRKRAVPLAVRKANRGKIDKYPKDGVCEDDQIPEFKEHPWVYWPNACTSFSVSSTLATSLSKEEASRIAAEAFAQWSSTRCPGVNGEARPSIDARDLGSVSCASGGYDPNGGPNQNIIVFRDAWDPIAAAAKVADSDILGLTTVTYDDTGHILDSDMQLNMQIQPATTDPVSSTSWDLRSIITHEFGHFIGFTHSAEADAVMYYQANVGETNKRYLTEDDKAVVCQTYTPDGKREIDPDQLVDALPCDPTPAGGFTDQCSAKATSGCASSPGVASTPILMAVGVAFAAFAARKRRSVAGL